MLNILIIFSSINYVTILAIKISESKLAPRTRFLGKIYCRVGRSASVNESFMGIGTYNPTFLIWFVMARYG